MVQQALKNFNVGSYRLKNGGSEFESEWERELEAQMLFINRRSSEKEQAARPSSEEEHEAQMKLCEDFQRTLFKSVSSLFGREQLSTMTA